MKFTNIIFSLILLLLGLSLSSCGLQSESQQSLYSWYDYDDIVYDYSKSRSPEARQRLLTLYQKLLDRPRGSRRTVPPGICAEYGYLLVKQGELERGLDLLKKEIELYPESEIFVGRIIKQLKK